MNEEEIKNLGYESVASNLYLKDNVLYCQHAGMIKECSTLTEKQLKFVTSIQAYQKELSKLGKKHPKENKEKPSTSDIGARALAPSIQPLEIVAPRVDVDQAVEVFNKFTDFKKKLLSADDFLYIGSDGKPTDKKKASAEYIKKSGWRKFSTVFNLDCQILHKSREIYEDPEGVYYVWAYSVRVTAPNGRFQDAEGCATSRDPFFTKGGKAIPEEKDIMLKSQTVAFNRAISDLIGGGAKTAEEL